MYTDSRDIWVQKHVYMRFHKKIKIKYSSQEFIFLVNNKLYNKID